MRSLFGTDGIRGEANVAPMTADLALRLGRAVAEQFRREAHRTRIAVGRDTRVSGPMLEAALVAGITSAGADALLLGELPTPGIAFLTTAMRADAGVVISASHNAFADNGLKVFGHDGFKLEDSVELELEARIHAEPAGVPRGREIGRVIEVGDAVGRYVTHLKSKLPRGFSLEGIRVVVDAAHGAAWTAAPLMLRELGAEVHAVGVSPDGTNINELCGSLSPEFVAHEVRARNAAVGIALDGDADRLILVDETGEVVDGDAVLAICALHMHRLGQLRGGAVVATVMSNLGLEHALGRAGIALERTAVGDRYVVQRMREGGFNFGGEQSGHLVFLDHSTTGDGMLAALQVLQVMAETGRTLSELASVLERVPQLLVNRRVKARPPIDSLVQVQAAIGRAEAELGRDGRVLVRYSGTEPKVRVMLEGLDRDRIRAHADLILEAFHVEVGLAEER